MKRVKLIITAMVLLLFVPFLQIQSFAAGKVWHVSIKSGSNRGDGSKAKPVKNIAKAIQKAQPGDVLHVAEGNYLGLLDAGYIDLNKPVSIIGGYDATFTERNPIKYKTMIQPRPNQTGTSSNKPLIYIDLKTGDATIDGIIFDRGWQTAYNINADKAKRGQPDGVESGMFMEPPFKAGNHGVKGVITNTSPMIGGKGVGSGKLTIKNCLFLNASMYGILLGVETGTIEVINNLFVACRMAACEIWGKKPFANKYSHSKENRTIKAAVIYKYNTVLFSWSRTKDLGDMGYGLRVMTRINTTMDNNILGACCFSGIDRTRVDSKEAEAARVVNVNNNIFFLNKEADVTLPSQGGKFMRIRAEQFEDVDESILTTIDNNVTLTKEQGGKLGKAIDKAYLEGFINVSYSEKSDGSENSAANNFRAALGLNRVVNVTSKTSMYCNYYPLDKAVKLIGVMPNVGMQNIK